MSSTPLTFPTVEARNGITKETLRTAVADTTSPSLVNVVLATGMMSMRTVGITTQKPKMMTCGKIR
jgi:hypothetical protein